MDYKAKKIESDQLSVSLEEVDHGRTLAAKYGIRIKHKMDLHEIVGVVCLTYADRLNGVNGPVMQCGGKFSVQTSYEGTHSRNILIEFNNVIDPSTGINELHAFAEYVRSAVRVHLMIDEALGR